MAATAGLVSVLHDSPLAQRPNNHTAAVLAIGTANPSNCIFQDEYPDWYFRVTKSDHLTTLKNKMKRICEKSGVKKRYFHYTEETLAGRPEFLDPVLPSLDARLAIVADAVPELAAAAAAKAIAEWGRPAADITHLVVSTNSGASSPGADLRLAELLGLRPTVQRTLFYLHGCFGGCSALRVARDLAENNRGARVLVAVSELSTTLSFGAPVEARPEALVVSALFGDGAGAVIVGAGPKDTVERPIFYMASAAQATLAGTERTIFTQLGNAGYDVGLSANAPTLVRDNIERCLSDMMAPLGLTGGGGGGGGGWNNLFWAVHPGGRAILDSCEAALALEPGKLAASRHVLSEYGNMLGATIIFVLDEIRRRRRQDAVDHNKADLFGCEWGLTLGIGPGVTIEMMLLRAAGENQH